MVKVLSQMSEKEIAEGRRAGIPENIMGKIVWGMQLEEKEKEIVKSRGKVYVLGHTKERGMIKVKPQLRDLPGYVRSDVVNEQFDLRNEKHLLEWIRVNEADNPDEILDTLNEKLGGYGVESITDERAWVSSYYGDIIGLYVNMGDTYDKTVVYDTENKEYLVTSWGDFYEGWESEQEFEDEE